MPDESGEYNVYVCAGLHKHTMKVEVSRAIVSLDIGFFPVVVLMKIPIQDCRILSVSKCSQ